MRINKFARKNVHLCDLKEQMAEKEVTKILAILTFNRFNL